MDGSFRGKTALVLASSQGLGKAIAAKLAEGGADVMLASRSGEKLEEVKQQLQKGSAGQIEYTVCDMTKPEDIQALVQKTAEIFGSIHILVNNSGGPPAGSFEDMADEQWQQAFELNLLSYIRAIRSALPYLKKQGGKIINIASSSIKEPIAGLILSNTFRTGIVGLSKTLAEELAAYGILVNTVAPGRIETDRLKYLDEINAEKQGVSVEQLNEQIKKKIPLGRYGRPEEFANVVAFLASDANTYMTGSSFLVDGGMIRSI
ncbi:SDR family oxidoreductase [Bacillus badius]|uniref:SDR family oxidoreductase n=1 Tax=Bacillus badius TaxID=1455 RepID=UPI0007B05BA3|nr:SDR family oxidoreductase [Bacillus badius]KZO01505.1 3-oxoacyl-ACP reductase [Bacillus badius]MED0667147.1 SDR family oxidoreductase [Bacillus badius]OCS89900.1 3-oxoacyl-ACP reductase [Bacillus badius]OVE53426.1 3-oxoacyl-ACP reductase [Bacillus badius]TDW05783.1 3-oxoacyl-[acyl-carrier protein] reductase [Bacillus badius]